MKFLISKKPSEKSLKRKITLTATCRSTVSYTHLNNEKVLVLLTDMTSYADALAIVSNRMEDVYKRQVSGQAKALSIPPGEYAGNGETQRN